MNRSDRARAQRADARALPEDLAPVDPRRGPSVGVAEVAVRQGVRACRYCLGEYEARRADSQCCSPACRQAVRAALRDRDPLPASCRRSTYSPERARATGYGLVTAGEAWQHDRRIRREAGLPEDGDTDWRAP